MGIWEPIRTQVWETIVRPCDCCGQVVAKQLWKAEVGGEERRFCGPACEELYRTYVLPRLGSPAGHDPGKQLREVRNDG
jgi:hypothetical protein